MAPRCFPEIKSADFAKALVSHSKQIKLINQKLCKDTQTSKVYLGNSLKLSHWLQAKEVHFTDKN